MESSEFIIIKLLGEGDFSKVYLCKGKESKKKYAMKVLKNNEWVERYYEVETNNLSKVSHDNIIKWIKSEKNGDNFCIITEYFPGKTLQYIIDSLKRPFRRNEILQIFTPLMSAISYLHSINVIHGDVCVVNIMVKFGKSKNVEAVKLIDFGRSDPSLIAPLVILDAIYDVPKGQMVDIFLCGVVLLKMLYGTSSPDILVDIAVGRILRPELVDSMLDRVDPFFRKLLYGMLFFQWEGQSFTPADEILCALKN